MQRRNVGALFAKELERWGFRGDPLLRQEMGEKLGNVEMPDSLEELLQILEEKFHSLTGHSSHSNNEYIHIERYEQGSGMSTGLISPSFWREQGFKALSDRFLRESETS